MDLTRVKGARTMRWFRVRSPILMGWKSLEFVIVDMANRMVVVVSIQ